MPWRTFFSLHKRGLLSLILVLSFVLSLAQIDWGGHLIHAGGKATLAEIGGALFKPDLSPAILKLGLIGSCQTLVYAFAGMGIAFALAIVFGVLSSGVLWPSLLLRTFFRGLLGFMRGIHELVWAWLFVAAIGLSPLAAIFALAIPYGGTLGRVFSDLLQDVPKSHLEALEASGAGALQKLVYGYFPSAFANILSYTMYRLECAVRASSIMSFVGLGGLGFQIQISLQDLRYDQVWTFLFFLVLLVVLIDRWSDLIRNRSGQTCKINLNRLSVYSLILLMVFSWGYVFFVDKANLFELFSARNMAYLTKFLGGLMGVGESVPAFLDGSAWQSALVLAWETFVMGILSIGFAVLAMLITVIPAAQNIADGSLTLKKSWYGKPLFYLMHGLYIFTRSIPELLWAMILVFILKPGILPGALALAVHNFGILGKLCSEVIEDMEVKPIVNLAGSGAGRAQLFLYGVIPTVMNRFLTYILYRWEVIIRTTIIVGFVGAGALGQNFKLAMSFFRYSEITLYLICYVLLVYITDLVSNICRKAIR